MRERPILFSGPMVRALLDGRKTQTRRTVKLPTEGEYIRPDMGGWSPSTIGGDDQHGRSVPEHVCLWNQTTGTTLACPYGVPGDRLWVKETHAIVPRTAYAMSDGVQQTLKPGDDHDAAVYAAGWERSKPGRWRPSIHMPRWASRLTLEITEVRVERLQDISDRGQPNDCIAEGVFADDFEGKASDWLERGFSSIEKARFHDLWTSINGPGSWDANPWVWAVSFNVLRAKGSDQ
jgi:hypothetical protein